MPLTIITLTNSTASLRGDLTKWMQEIAVGVYVGNFNVKVREELWERVKQNVGQGQATISYSSSNEIGYEFDTFNAKREIIDFDGVPLVFVPISESTKNDKKNYKLSDASIFHEAKKFSSTKAQSKTNSIPYIILDLETDGLDEKKNSIIEIGAIKIMDGELQEFHAFIEYSGVLPEKIKELTGIKEPMLQQEGKPLPFVMQKFLDFIEDFIIIGYNVEFDIRFLNRALENLSKQRLRNKNIDLMKLVKKEKVYLPNYKLETVLKAYEIDERVKHRALLDVRLMEKLISKVNGFDKLLGSK